MIPHAGSPVLQRRLRIADAIRREGSVRVEALSERLGVSTVTVRSDLAYLEAQGMVLRGAGVARAMPDPPGRPDTRVTPPAASVLRAARALLPEEGTVLLGPGGGLLRLLPLLGDGSGLSLLLCGLDAVPVARACTAATLHLLGGAIGADGTLGGPQAAAALASHEVASFVAEARCLRGDAAVLRGFAEGEGEAFALEAAARAGQVLVLVTGETGGDAGAAPLLPLRAATHVLLQRSPDAEERAGLERAGLEQDGTASRFRRVEPGRAGRERAA